MDIKLPKEVPLFEAEGITAGDKQFLSQYKTKSGIGEVQPNTISREYSGYAGLGYKSGWHSCLMAVRNNRTYSVCYLYIPLIFVHPNEIDRWCKFVSMYYKHQCKYIGEGYVNGFEYFGLQGGNCVVKVGFIAMYNEGADYSSTEQIILNKVTMLRYIFRTYHKEYIVEPLYQMVEEQGLNPWDAMVLAHYVLLIKQEKQVGMIPRYNSARGLVGAQGMSLYWPRSYDQMVQSFKELYYINNVWCGKNNNTMMWLGSAALPEISAIANHSFGFFNIYQQNFSNSLGAFFEKKDYIGAMKLYKAHCKEHLPFLKALDKTKGERTLFSAAVANEKIQIKPPVFLKKVIDHIESL